MSNPRSAGLELHPRYLPVQAEYNALEKLILDYVEHADLTTAELVIFFQQQAQGWMKYVLRAERHPDNPDKKANER